MSKGRKDSPTFMRQALAKWVKKSRNELADTG